MSSTLNGRGSVYGILLIMFAGQHLSDLVTNRYPPCPAIRNPLVLWITPVWFCLLVKSTAPARIPGCSFSKHGILHARSVVDLVAVHHAFNNCSTAFEKWLVSNYMVASRRFWLIRHLRRLQGEG